MVEIPLWFFVAVVSLLIGILKWQLRPQCPDCGSRRKVYQARLDPNYLRDERITGFDVLCGNGKCGASFGEVLLQHTPDNGLMS